MNTADRFLEIAASVLDAGALQRLRELDPGNRNGIVERVLHTYHASLGSSLSALAAARGQTDTLRRLAHTLKSSSASVGALGLSSLCAEVEGLARDGRLAELPDAVERMRAEGARLHEALSEASHA